MNTRPSLALLLVWGLISGAFDAPAATNLFPGVTLYDYPPALEGQLAMMLADGPDTNAAPPATIYTFDLQTRALRRAAHVPEFGLFAASPDGALFCVLYTGYRRDLSKAFLYSRPTSTARMVLLPSSVVSDAFRRGHAFFVMEFTNGLRILHYDIDRDSKSLLDLSGASTWQYQSYKNMCFLKTATNLLYFEYKAFGKRLRDGRDYPSGHYSYNLQTGKIEFVANRIRTPVADVAANGRYIFFAGSEAPVSGTKLVSSSADCDDLRDADGKRQGSVKVLKRFS